MNKTGHRLDYPFLVPLSHIGEIALGRDTEFIRNSAPNQSMDHRIEASTRICVENERTRWDLKRYKNFLRKSYQLRLKPSILRARSVKRRPSVSYRAELASKYRLPEQTLDGEVSICSIGRLGSAGEGSSSSKTSMAIQDEEERETDERRATEMTAHKLFSDTEQEYCKCLAEVLSESWNLLNDDAWNSNVSYDNSMDQADIDIVKEIHAIKSLIQAGDLSAAECDDHLVPRISAKNDVLKNGDETFDKYKLVCPNHVVGGYGTLY